MNLLAQLALTSRSFIACAALLSACAPAQSAAPGDCGSLTSPRSAMNADALAVGHSTHAFLRDDGSLRVILNPMLREPSQVPVSDLQPENLQLDLESVPVSQFALTRVTATDRAAIDVVFAIDTAEGAPWTIAGVRRGINAFVQELQQMGFDPALGGIEFSDDVRSRAPLGSLAAFRVWLAGLTPHGGGDVPSSALDALEQLNHFEYRREATRYTVLLTRGGLHERGDGTACSSFTFDDAAFRVRFANLTTVIYALNDAGAGIDPTSFTRAIGGLALPLSADTTPHFDLENDEPPVSNVLENSYLLTVPASAVVSGALSGAVQTTVDGQNVLLSFMLTP